MPGVNGYRGDMYAGGGAYQPAHNYGVGNDPYVRPERQGREYAGAKEDPYSYQPTHSGQPPRGAPYTEDPYTAARSAPAEDPYGRHPKEDPYGYGRTGRPEDVYGRVHKADRHPNGMTAPKEEFGRTVLSDPSSSPFPQFEMDHLATFSVGSKQGLMLPADGIRKLRQMEMSTGIWTMRILLVVEPREIIIIDRASQEEMERFPVSLVADPTAVTNEDRRDVYNNIVLFTVTEDPHRGAPSEMHMFQCVGKPAHEVVDDIKEAKSGQVRGPVAMRQQDDRPPHPVQDQLQAYEQQARANYDAYNQYQPGPPGSHPFMKPSARRDDESVISDRTDRDVQLLNHCFDDIEKFVGRLQYAAEAFRELDKRRKGRNNNKHKDRRSMGDGMLSMRARPPPAKDFVDIFQKFKLSFNLLAKLKPHIHDPNAPELVHFLFTPLSLVVEASKDPRHGTPDVAAKVLSPLLTHDAKDLLINCLTSKETDLWDSLGDAWRHTTEDYRGSVPPYFPRFSDGWEPPRAWSTEPSHPVSQTRAEHHRNEEPPYESRNGHNYNGAPYTEGPYGRYNIPSDSSPSNSYRHGNSIDRLNAPRAGPAGFPPLSVPPDLSPPDSARSRPKLASMFDPLGAGHDAGNELSEHQYSDRNPQDAHRRALDEYEQEMERRRKREAERNRARDQEIEEQRALERREQDRREHDRREHDRREHDRREHDRREQDRREQERRDQERRDQERQDQSRYNPPKPRQEAPPSGTAMNPQQQAFLRDIESQGKKPYEITHAREGRNVKELSVDKDEIVEVVDNSRNWWKVRNSKGEVGHVPNTILREFRYGGSGPAADSRHDNHPGPETSTYSPPLFVDTNSTPPEFPYHNNSPGAPVGLSPKPPPDVTPRPDSHPQRTDSLRVDEPPVTPPTPNQEQPEFPSEIKPRSKPVVRIVSNKDTKPQLRNPPIRKPSKRSSTQDPDNADKIVHNIQRNPLQENLTDELMGRVVSGEVSPRPVLSPKLPKTPDVFINIHSTEGDVQDWLQAKGFSPRLMNRLRGFNGKEILKIGHRDLEHLAVNETNRLESQITLSRKISGYTLGKSFELQAILRSRKEELEYVEL